MNIRSFFSGGVKRVPSVVNSLVDTSIGQHILAEFNTSGKVFDLTTLESAVEKAVKESGATRLGAHFSGTPTDGISGGVMIAESHFIVHYDPERNYLGFDSYTCGAKIDPRQATKIFADAIGLQPYDTAYFKRGIIPRGGDLSENERYVLNGIAVEANNSLTFFPRTQVQIKPQHCADHYVIEVHLADPTLLSNAERLANLFAQAFETLPPHHQLVHQFPPQGEGLGGASVVLIGKRWHLTTHPWSENKYKHYAPIDVFIDQRSGIDHEKVIKNLVDGLAANREIVSSIHCFARGVMRDGKLVPSLAKLAIPLPIASHENDSQLILRPM